MQGPEKLMVWCRIWGNKIVGPVFFDTNLNAEMYLNMLQDTTMPSLLNEMENFWHIFSKTGHTSSWYLRAAMVGSRLLDWSPWSHGVARSPDLTSLDVSCGNT
jgi:hypothetical protein